MPRRSYPRPLIYEQLCAELLTDPLRQEKPMGRHHDTDADGIADQGAPGRRNFTHDDGSVYERIPAADIDDDGDQIDSTTIVDDGAPA